MKILFCSIALSVTISFTLFGQGDPGTPFNPFSPPGAGVRITPTPTPDKSKVPSNGNINRNSSVNVPGNGSAETYRNPNSPGRADSFGNGARAILSGDTLLITDASGHQTSFKRTGPAPPAHTNMKLTGRCLRLKHWLDANSCNSATWRRVCLDYFDNCE